jgi:TonB family protein
MFTEEPKPKRSSKPLIGSIVVHAVILTLLIWKPLPHYVKTESALHGMGGTSHGTVYLKYGGAQKVRKASDVDDVQRAHLHLPKRRPVCPPGLKGDVIVEVTIDEKGNIISTRLLSGLGHGVDERVVAVVQNWRYNPATRDGLPIPSQQDVHFHFPS